MQVKLKVISGSHAGKEIKVSLAKFFIGRGEDCHLRPQSDLISRHHCAIIIEEGQAIIRDLKSRNGTLVNGEKISGDYTLKMGDVVKVGPLEFAVQIDHSLGGAKKAKVTDVKDAAARVAEPEKKSKDETIDDSIGSWLEEADEEERSNRISTPQTRQFKLDTGALKAATETAGDPAAAPTHDTGKQAAANADTKTTDKDADKKDKKKEKKEYGKLPQVSKEGSQSSRDAAADMLKKFFNRR